MNLKNAFLLNCLLAGVFGLAFLIVPAQLLEQYGIHLMPKAGIFVARLLGTTLIGIALVSWFASARATGDLRSNMALTFFIIDAPGPRRQVPQPTSQSPSASHSRRGRLCPKYCGSRPSNRDGETPTLFHGRYHAWIEVIAPPGE